MSLIFTWQSNMSGSDRRDYDAVVVGSGPNGLAAAIRLQEAGLSVIVLEAKDTVGGGLRSAEVTLPGFTHDICSAIHPLAVASPYFRTLPLHEHGLEYIHPAVAAAHPFDAGDAAALFTSPDDTAHTLGSDGGAYIRLMRPLVQDWAAVCRDVLGPLKLPDHPLAFARFGVKALTSAHSLSRRFNTEEARGFWAGMAAHSIQPLANTATSAIGLVLLLLGHTSGWPFPKGGAGHIARSLASYFTSKGGTIQLNFPVRSMGQLPAAHAVLFDITPRQLLEIAGHRFSAIYKWQLRRYRYGMGVFKIDWALDGPTPFSSPLCRKAGTLHLGNTYREIYASEEMIWKGKHTETPFVLFAQPAVYDASRAPEGKQTAWAYCHVPHGSTVDMTARIERQVERFAPGFRDRILARHTLNAMEMESYNPNYVGGDINGGVSDITQIFTRPALRLSPYRTSAKGLYICSSSTPPGGGVHGMCGLHAADCALRDVFHVRIKNMS